MESLSELKSETTLASIAMCPEANSHWLLFAIVLDITEPLLQKESGTYVTKLKVIDPSFNYKEEIRLERLKFHKFVHINIYSNMLDECPQVTTVGDIIRLRRFRFKFSQRGELVGSDVKFSNWLVYSGKKDDTLVSYSYKPFDKNVHRVMTAFEENRIKDLRNWIHDFFSKNSLKYIGWWNDLREVDVEADADELVLDKIDLVVKCTRIKPEKGNLVMKDRDGRTFKLKLHKKTTLRIGDIIKLRCVELKKKSSNDSPIMIHLNNLSSFILVPPFSYDYKQLIASESQKANKVSEIDSSSLFPFLSDYGIEDSRSSSKTTSDAMKDVYCTNKSPNFITAIKKIHSEVTQSTVSDLLVKIEKPTDLQAKVFVVNGFISSFLTTNPKKVIKIYQISEKRFIDFDRSYLITAPPNSVRIVYHLVLNLKDESVAKFDLFLEVYILTSEYESHLFQSWDILPGIEDIDAWSRIKDSTLTLFEKRLKQTCSSDFKVKMALEMLVTKTGKPFFRMTDTVFLPF